MEKNDKLISTIAGTVFLKSKSVNVNQANLGNEQQTPYHAMATGCK